MVARIDRPWAEDYVYPHDDREHNFAHFYLRTVNDPLPSRAKDFSRSYGSYLFPFFLAHWSSPYLVANIWHLAQAESLLKAIDEAVPGGFASMWPQFTLDKLE